MKKFFLLTPAVALLLSACSNEEPAINTEEDDEFTFTLSDKALAVMPSVLSFSKNMMDKTLEYWKETGTENATISPLGAAMNLGMLANGSTGSNLDEILAAFEDVDLSGLNTTMNELLEGLPGVNKYTDLNIANSVWVNDGYTLNNTYLDNLNRYFKATATATDLGSDKGKIAIDNWVEKNTDGAIKDYYKPGSSMFVILNTLLYRSCWEKEFKKSDTKPAVFHNSDGSESVVDMMNGTQHVSYCETDNWLLLRVFFKKGDFALNITVPKSENAKISSDILTMRFSSTDSELPRIVNGTTQLSLPKFVTEGKTDLKPVLSRMGINSIFTPSGSGFANIFDGDYSERDLAVDLFEQTINMAINEKGAEVVSVTHTGLVDGMPLFNKIPEKIEINRPFIFTITRQNPLIILAMGCVNKL